MEYNKTKARGYTLGHDTPSSQHMKRVKEITSNVGLPFFSFAKRNQIQDFLCPYIFYFKLLFFFTAEIQGSV